MGSVAVEMECVQRLAGPRLQPVQRLRLLDRVPPADLSALSLVRRLQLLSKHLQDRKRFSEPSNLKGWGKRFKKYLQDGGN